MANTIKSIAIFGATGQLGTSVINSLLSTGRHSITAVTRSQSTAKLPSSVEVVKGDLTSSKFLISSLRGQDAVIIALGLDAPQSLDERIVTAAAEAGVRYIVPNEFVSQDDLRKHFPFNVHEKKNAIRTLIEMLGVNKWIAIVNGTWYDYSLQNGLYNIDVKNRRATIWTPDAVSANVTTLAKVGKSIAALFSLNEARLENYTNRCVYISSFKVSQLDILRSVQKATGTESRGWDISYENAQKAVDEGHKLASQGDVAGFIKVTYALQFLPGAGGDYESSKGTANKDLGLEDEDFDETTQILVAEG